MNLIEKTGEAVLELAQNERVQEKAVGVLGMLAPYIGIEKRAVDLYINDIEKSNLSTETKIIALLNAKKTIKKLKNQKEIADIASRVAREGTDFSEHSGVDDEWLDRYMESASYVSSEQMQLVWGKILANEFESPRSTPPNMIRILSEFTKSYADAFRKICSMRALVVSLDSNGNIIHYDWEIIVPFEDNKTFMNQIGINLGVLNELETLGVIKLDNLAGYAITDVKGQELLVYVDGVVKQMDNNTPGKFPIGDVVLTSAGKTLLRITEYYSIDKYSDVVFGFLRNRGFVTKSESEYDVSISGEDIAITRKQVGSGNV